jgi:hypothetical protein
VVVHVERGKEYLAVDEPVTAQGGRTTEVHIILRRWFDMREKGWYSADMHVHFINEDRRVKTAARFEDDLRILKQMTLADDVNFVPVFSFWNDNIESWPSWPTGPYVRADDYHLVTLANQEIERIAKGDAPAFESVGAPLFFGLTKPVYTPRLEAVHPCDVALCRIARKHSPDSIIDLEKPLWAETVVGVALGVFDCVQLCHNHYNRDKTIRMGWGMIGPDLEDKGSDWGNSEILNRSNLTYYRWLNCGFHLAATGGSAVGVMPAPLGQSRTYAKLDGPLSEASYFKAIRAGRTFATTGPMLFLTVNGHEVGSRLDRSSGDRAPLRVRAELQSIQRMESLELIHNGRVLSRMVLSDAAPSPVLNRVLETKFAPQRSGWVAARASYRCPDGSLHQAHTSPVYISVDGKPTLFRSDAEFMIRWIDRILQISDQPGRYASTDDRREAQAIFREARAVYERIADQAKAVWNE